MSKNSKNEGSIRVLTWATEGEQGVRKAMTRKLKSSPVAENELLFNLGLYMPRQSLSRALFMAELYRQIVPVHGVVMEFGVRWGQNMAYWSNLRGIYEPYNYNRKIVGFDTFAGFPGVDESDGAMVQAGDYGVSEHYEEYLRDLLLDHEACSPLPDKNKFELVKGNAVETLPAYLEANPATVVALAYFDFDLYEPTKACLEAIKDRVTRGSILAFDELNCPEFPGETKAVMEVLGLPNLALRRSPLNPLISYSVVD